MGKKRQRDVRWWYHLPAAVQAGRNAIDESLGKRVTFLGFERVTRLDEIGVANFFVGTKKMSNGHLHRYYVVEAKDESALSSKVLEKL